VVQAGFRQRRKQIHNGLARELPVAGAAVADALAGCEIDGERRPQTLRVDEWACLAERLSVSLPADGAA
jgi:16S rRNA (adenine1518-N6/adenine1519-N6)-dimethyltransferase